MKRLATAIFSILTVLALPQEAFSHSTDYPARAVTVLTPFAAGNSADALARALAAEMSRETGQPFVVEGKPGAGGVIGAQAAAKASADGYKIFLTGITTLVANRFLYKKLPYDPVKDFQPVTTLAKGPSVLLVNPNLPAKSVTELIALAKKNPGKLTYGAGTAVTRLNGELLQKNAGIKLTRVPYQTSTQALPDLMGGQIDMLFFDLTALPLVKEGKVRMLAIADSKRSPVAPDVPTLKEAGVMDSDAGFMLQVAVPAGTPMPIVERIRTLLLNAASQPQVQQVYANAGMYPYFSTPQEMADLNERETRIMGEIARSVGWEAQ